MEQRPESVVEAKLSEMEQRPESVATREDLERLKQDITSLSKSVERFTDELKRVEEKMNNLNMNGTGNTGGIDEERLMDLVLSELGRRQYRRRCLLISNLPESTDPNPALRMAYDINTVNKLFVEVLGIDVQLERSKRLRRSARGAIPKLLIEFKREDDKMKIIHKLGILKHYQRQVGTEWENTWFSPCLTNMQLKELNGAIDRLNNQAYALGQGRPWYIDINGNIRHRTTRETVHMKYSIAN